MKNQSKDLKALKVKTLAFTFMVILLALFLYASNEPIHASELVNANGESEIFALKENTLNKNTESILNDNTDSPIDTILTTEDDYSGYLNCYCSYCTSYGLSPCVQFIGCFDSINENKLFFLKLSAERLQ